MAGISNSVYVLLLYCNDAIYASYGTPSFFLRLLGWLYASLVCGFLNRLRMERSRQRVGL